MKIIYSKNRDWEAEESQLAPYIAHCREVIRSRDFESLEASLCLPSDNQTLTQVLGMVKKKNTATLKYVIVVGIGGSNLGTKSIYDALSGSIDQLTPDRFPKMFFLDTIDPKVNMAFLNYAKNNFKTEDEFIISIISKSGGTTEPLVNAEILLADFATHFPKWKDRCVIITDSNSKLEQEGKRLGIDVLSIPKKVGGRYSVFSAVGLFPLAMAQIDIKSLLKGAEEMRDQCMTDSPENYARFSSIFQYLNWKAGKNIHNSFFFHPELESMGKWYRQLMGESLGKEQMGITPIVSVGSVDHHSMVQLYWGGPKDKTTELVYSLKPQEYTVPEKPLFAALSTTEGRQVSDIMQAIQKGTAIAYEKQKEPYFEVVFDEINEYELGQYLQYKMVEMVYLANLMGINAFDQPQVELYKIETKKILAEK